MNLTSTSTRLTIRVNFKSWFCDHKWHKHASKTLTAPSLVILKQDGNVDTIVDGRQTITEILICEKCGTIVKLIY